MQSRNERGEGIGKRHIPPLYTPDSFNQFVEAKQNLRKLIAGYSTVSATHILKCADTAEPFTLKTWGEAYGGRHVNVELNVEAYKSVYEETTIYPEWEFPQGMENNRTMGYNWTVVELLMQTYPEISLSQAWGVLEGFDPFVTRPLTKTLKNINPKSIDELFEITEDNTFLFPYEGEEEKASLERVKEVFPDPQIFFTFLRELEKRKGVQVIFGPTDKFLEFLGEQEYMLIDDVGVGIKNDIPGNLILGIVPLGEYEQQLLLNS